MDYDTILSKIAINYIEIILCASILHAFNIVLIFCPHSTDENTIMLWWIACNTNTITSIEHTRWTISEKLKLIRQVVTPVQSHMLTDGRTYDTHHTIIQWTFVRHIKISLRDSNFLVLFSSSKSWRMIDRGEGMTHWCWAQLVMKHGMCSTCST